MRVILFAAQSLDGRITLHDKPGMVFASRTGRRRFHAALKGFDCSVMGGETFRVSEKAIRGRADDGRLQVVMSGRGGAGIPGVLEFSGAGASAREVVEGLRARGKSRCALLGGGRIYGEFLAAGLVDEVWITLEPRIFGGGVALSASVVDVRLRFLGCEAVTANTLLLKYEVRR